MSCSFLTLPFQYVGNKREVIPRLQQHLPKHETFVSVFGGSGAELIAKKQEGAEVFNDRNSDILNVFRVLRVPAQRNQLHQLLQMPPSREEYHHCLTILSNPSSSPVQRAYAFIYSSALSYGSKDPSICTPGCFAPSKARGRALRRRWARSYLEKIAERFRHVTLENLNYKELMTKYSQRKDVLFGCDPPYHPEAHSQGRLYKHDWGAGDHEEFLDFVLNLNRKMYICGYYNELYNRRLAGWRVYEYKTHCTISRTKGAKSERIEVVWANW